MSVLAGAEIVRPIREQQADQSPVGGRLVHTRRRDPRAVVGYELLWENADAATWKAVEHHLEQNGHGEFDYWPPGSLAVTCVYAPPSIDWTMFSAARFRIGLTLATALTQDT